MANATQIVKKGVVRRTDEFIVRSLATLAADTLYYQNAGLGVLMSGAGAGYLAKFDDTAAMRFFGVVADQDGTGVLTRKIGTQGADGLLIRAEQPQRFELAVSGVAVTDIGRLVYALDDQTGTLNSSATTYGNVYGIVIDVVSSGIALVQPLYQTPNGDELQVIAASGAAAIRPGTVIITKAGVAAVTLADPTTGIHDGLRMTFVSSTAQKHTLSNGAGSGFDAGGAASDVGSFGGAIGDGMTVVAYGGKWLVIGNTNVTLA